MAHRSHPLDSIRICSAGLRYAVRPDTNKHRPDRRRRESRSSRACALLKNIPGPVLLTRVQCLATCHCLARAWSWSIIGLPLNHVGEGDPREAKTKFERYTGRSARELSGSAEQSRRRGVVGCSGCKHKTATGIIFFVFCRDLIAWVVIKVGNRTTRC